MSEAAEKARSSGNVQWMIDAVPYARTLGMQAISNQPDTFLLPPKQSNVGNPTLPALHGGAVGGFLEMSAAMYLIMEIMIG